MSEITDLTAAVNKLILITKVNGSLLKNPNNDKDIDVEVPATGYPSASPFVVYNRRAVAGPYGARLASVSYSVDAIFQSNFYWKSKIDGITTPSATFQPWDSTVSTFEEVPTGNPFLLKPGAGIAIYAYNANSSNTSNGIMSVSVVAADLTEDEYEAVT